MFSAARGCFWYALARDDQAVERRRLPRCACDGHGMACVCACVCPVTFKVLGLVNGCCIKSCRMTVGEEHHSLAGGGTVYRERATCTYMKQCVFNTLKLQ